MQVIHTCANHMFVKQIASVHVAMVPHVRYLNICRLCCCDVILVSFVVIRPHQIKGCTNVVISFFMLMKYLQYTW